MPFYIILFSFGIAFQGHWHLNTEHAGFAFLPMTMTIGLLSVFGGKIVDRVGAKLATVYTATLYAIGFILLATLGEYLSSLWVSILLILPGLAFAIGSPASMTQSLQSTPKDIQGSASGIFYMVSLIAGLLGVSIAGLIMQGGQHIIGPMIVCIGLSVASLCIRGIECFTQRN